MISMIIKTKFQCCHNPVMPAQQDIFTRGRLNNFYYACEGPFHYSTSIHLRILFMQIKLYEISWVIPCQMNKVLKKLHQMFHILMKFGILLDLTEIIRMQKKFL